MDQFRHSKGEGCEGAPEKTGSNSRHGKSQNGLDPSFAKNPFTPRPDDMERVHRMINEIADDAEGLEVPDDATALDFLCAVYRCRDQPMARRMKAASEAAQYMHPTFKATAMVVANDSFAARLEAAIARSGLPKDQPKLIEAQAVAEPAPLPPTGPSPTPMAAPFASFRRRG